MVLVLRLAFICISQSHWKRGGRLRNTKLLSSSKSIPYPTSHTYLAYIWEFPHPPQGTLKSDLVILPNRILGLVVITLEGKGGGGGRGEAFLESLEDISGRLPTSSVCFRNDLPHKFYIL